MKKLEFLNSYQGFILNRQPSATNNRKNKYRDGKFVKNCLGLILELDQETKITNKIIKTIFEESPNWIQDLEDYQKGKLEGKAITKFLLLACKTFQIPISESEIETFLLSLSAFSFRVSNFHPELKTICFELTNQSKILVWLKFGYKLT